MRDYDEEEHAVFIPVYEFLKHQFHDYLYYDTLNLHEHVEQLFFGT